MSNHLQKSPMHGHKLPWNYTAAAYLFFITLSAATISLLPETYQSPKQARASSEKPFVSMLERSSTVHDLSKVSSAHRAPGSGHGAL
jgi:hypothetical protein